MVQKRHRVGGAEGISPVNWRHMEQIGALLLAFSILVFVAAIYFTPLLVASHRRHRQTLPIAALNLLLGWTLIGWAVSLVWALMVEEAA